MEQWQQDNKTVVAKYSRLLSRYHLECRALDWGSRESQELRFAILCQIGPLSGSSVLDVGCGLADFYHYLQAQGIEVEYTGYDLTPAMIDAARRRFPKIRLEVRDLMATADTSSRFDYVVASGIFYLRRIEPQAYLETMVRQMFGLCRRGVAFNTLSAAASRQQSGEFYAQPGETLTRCLKITPRVVLRHDYLPHDFTVYLYREGK
jgi:ubiquinone/menaquinone biosynthesis C-methylase UbiE